VCKGTLGYLIAMHIFAFQKEIKVMKLMNIILIVKSVCVMLVILDDL
jgi:hypothetical protein